MPPQTPDFFLFLIVVLASLAVFIFVQGVRWMSGGTLGKNAFNERLKFIAASADRMGTACLIAAFITPDSRLTRLNVSIATDAKGLLVTAVWILGSVPINGVHLVAGV